MPDRGDWRRSPRDRRRASPFHPPADRFDPVRGPRRRCAARAASSAGGHCDGPGGARTSRRAQLRRAVGRGRRLFGRRSSVRPTTRKHRRCRRAGRAGPDQDAQRQQAGLPAAQRRGSPVPLPAREMPPAPAQCSMPAWTTQHSALARVEGLLLRASIASWESGDATVAQLCEQAMVEAGDDRLLQARVHATFAETSPSGARTDLFHAEAAVSLLESIDDAPSGLLASALTNVAMHMRSGSVEASPSRRWNAQPSFSPRPSRSPSATEPPWASGCTSRSSTASRSPGPGSSVTWTSAVDEGDDSALPVVLGHLAALECWEGHYELAVDLATQGREHAERMGIRAPMPASVHVLALAHQGHVDQALVIGAADLAADEAAGFTSAMALDLRSLGTAELFAGNVQAAADLLTRALAISRERRRHQRAGDPPRAPRRGRRPRDAGPAGRGRGVDR